MDWHKVWLKNAKDVAELIINAKETEKQNEQWIEGFSNIVRLELCKLRKSR